MPKVKVYNLKAEEVGTMTLKDEVFGLDYNESLIHEVVVGFLANQRQGNKSTLTRSEVRGHAKKPWNQKHTGRARHGDTKGPQFTGGGVVFAPKPRDFSKKINKQAKKVAFRSALSTKLASKEFTVVENFGLEEGKTKLAQSILDSFKLGGKTLFITCDADENLLRATANIPSLEVVDAKLVNTYEVVAHKNILASKDAVKVIEEAYAE
ncbi:MAG: 50S ribosomal protein L4 [Clostridiales bacterium]|nr:50S ribosomal protein L4 [Candidatus Apopatousia equi]